MSCTSVPEDCKWEGFLAGRGVLAASGKIGRVASFTLVQYFATASEENFVVLEVLRYLPFRVGNKKMSVQVYVHALKSTTYRDY